MNEIEKITIAAAAARFHRSAAWLRRLCQTGRIPSWRVNSRLYLIDPNDVAAWIANAPPPGRPKRTNQKQKDRTAAVKAPSAVTENDFMDFSPELVQLLREYIERVEQEENPREAMERLGFTARELGLRRTKAHNALMRELARAGIDISDRAAITELARRFDKWMRE
jgi:hypothetical protein